MNRLSDHELWDYIREHHPHAAIIAAGGINRENVVDYARTGADAIVTSPYQAGMTDLTSSWKHL
ncbi:MAG: hypothetical protein MUP09_04130 [Thiovulaceae bacterium]|nr:hypothetical protein [Sulfurimonadaceae bacterium]